MKNRQGVCGFCGASAITERLEEEKFVYGSGDEAVVLSALVPIFECTSCGEAYTGEDAEVLRHAAVCNYLGRLTPAEIRAIRGQYDLTQEQLAELSGFGIASIKRWESGYQIQNLSADRYLRLFRVPQNFRLLQMMDRARQQPPSFRTHISERTIQEATAFRLRPMAEMDTAA